MLSVLAAAGSGVALSSASIHQLKHNHGDFSTTSKCFLGLGSAAVALNGLSLFNWGNYYLKIRQGDIEFHGANQKYRRTMWWFWILIMLAHLVTIALASIDMFIADDPEAADIMVMDDELKGDYAHTAFTLSVADLSLVGLALGAYMYAVYGTGQEKTVILSSRSRHGF